MCQKTHLGGVKDHPGGVADEEEDDDDDEHLGYPLVSPLSVSRGPDIRVEDRDHYQIAMCVLGWLQSLRNSAVSYNEQRTLKTVEEINVGCKRMQEMSIH